MKVALVNLHFSEFGSLDREFVLLARQLALRGVDVHVYCDPAARVADANATFHAVASTLSGNEGRRFKHPVEIGTFAWRASRALARDRSQFDIIHVAGQSAWMHDVVSIDGVTREMQREWARNTPHRAARLRSAAAPVLQPRIAVLRIIERLQFRPGGYRRVIARSQRIRAELEREHGISPDDIDVVPFPITADVQSQPTRDVRADLGLSADTRVVLFIGHNFERKGLEEAIRGVALTDAHLMVVGDGDAAPYRQLAGELGLSERIRFVGGTTKPGDYFAAADVVLAPSRQEAWGIPVIEAMAYGIPVVTRRLVGAAAEVTDAEAGIVLDTAEPEAIGGAMMRLFRDPELRIGMGRRGLEAATAYSPEAVARATLDTYSRALTGRALEPLTGYKLQA